MRHLMKRRHLAALVAVTLAGGMLAGCGGGDTPAADSNSGDASGKVSGSLHLAWRSNDEETGRKVVAAYKAARPGVDVTLDILPFQSAEFRKSLLTRKLANNLPDVFQSIDRMAPLTADAQISVDITPFLESGGPIKKDLFSSPFLNQYVVGDKIHGLPVTGDAVVLYYNKKQFDDAHLEYPTDSWTWEDMVAAAQKLTVGKGDATSQYGFVTTYDWNAMYVPMTVAEGGKFLDDQGHTLLGSPAAVAAFTKLLQPAKDGWFAPQSVIAAQGGSPATVFANGTASMLAGVRGWLPGIRSGIKSDFDVVTLPSINGKKVNGMGSRSLSMTAAGQKNSKVTYDFLTWFYSEDGMKLLTSTYAVVPPIKSLYDSPIWRDLPAPPKNNDAFVKALDTGVIVPNVPAAAQGAIDDGVKTAVEGVLIGNMSIEKAFGDANAKINAAIDRAK